MIREIDFNDIKEKAKFYKYASLNYLDYDECCNFDVLFNDQIGKKLMEQAICYGVNKGAIKGFLSADLQNNNAIRLYNKYGFIGNDTRGELQMRKIVKGEMSND